VKNVHQNNRIIIAQNVKDLDLKILKEVQILLVLYVKNVKVEVI